MTGHTMRSMRRLQDDPEYRAALKEKHRVQWVLAAGNLSPRDRWQLALRKMHHAATISRLEERAMASDAQRSRRGNVWLMPKPG